MTTIIINITQHTIVEDQIKDLENRFKEIAVINPEGDMFKKDLTFVNMPSVEELVKRARKIANDSHIVGASYAVVAGAPYFMAALEKELFRLNIVPMYSFSERVSQETKEADGSVRKVNVFKHVGFIEANADIYEGY